MAQFFSNFYSHEVLSFDHFINCVKSLYSGPESLDSNTLHLLAEMLYQLAQNKKFLASQVSLSKSYQHHSNGLLDNDDLYILYQNQRPFFKVCAQIWHPIPKRGSLKNNEPTLRDYNFASLTTNYFGPGCAAQLYEYQCRPDLKVGQHCGLAFNQFHQLSRDEVMFIEASKDVLAQALPKSLSISISLMFESSQRPSFTFDQLTGRVRSKISEQPAQQAALVAEPVVTI
ncbi:transposase [Pseudoalteromonas 'SMAR']|uniref:transposase n=1 Tax=Pseudoalteromonas 'SMAR' TaxID=3416908 RepID=UPI003AF1EFEE